MKFKTLKIRNIASIESADIDFDGDVLGDKGLFLICGPTGSGKTTILDAICMALFDDTPRVSNSKKLIIDAYDTDSDDKSVINNVKDIMHLVRKNAVDASVELTFEAEGRTYTATWKVYRTGQFKNDIVTSTFAKLSRADQLKKKFQKQWYFTDDEGISYTKNVEKELQRIIKMSFDQFCKTTMLAQGDFTKFLSSDADEKAIILEKLVGTEQYGEVGSVINKTYNEQKNEVDGLNRELNNFIFLTPQQREEKDTEIKNLEAETTALSKQRESVNQKIKWIADRKSAEDALKSAQEGLETANKNLQSEEATESLRTIELWDKTSVVRSALNKLKECESADKENEDRRQKLQKSYDTDRAGLLYLQETTYRLKSENIVLAQEIDSLKPFADMFAKADVIISKRESIVNHEDFIRKHTPNLKDYDEKLRNYEEQVKELTELKAKANIEIENLEKDIDQLNAQIKELDEEKLNKEVTALNDHRLLVNKVETVYNSLVKASHAYDDKLKEKAKLLDEISKQTETAKVAKLMADEAQSKAKISQEVCEKAFLALNNHATALRAKLQKGDKCPVCGHDIDELVGDDAIKESLAPLKTQSDSDKDYAEALAKRVVDANTHLEASKKHLETLCRDLAKAKDAFDKDIEAMKEQCEKLGINFDDTIVESIEALRQTDNNIKDGLNERRDKIAKIRTEINTITANIKEIRSERISEIDKKTEAVIKKIETVIKQKSETEGKINKAQSSIEELKGEVASLLHPDWTPKDSDRFNECLRADALHYASINETFAKNITTIESTQNQVESIGKCRGEIEGVFPELSERQALNAAEVKNLSENWGRLQSTAKELQTRILETNAKRLEAEQLINAYKLENPELDFDEVIKLMGLSPKAINNHRDLINELNTTLTRAKTLYDEAAKRLNDLAVSPLEEGESEESLKSSIESIDLRMRECSEQIGQIKEALKADTENQRNYGDKKAMLQEKEEEMNQWAVLNKYLGSTDGKLFRNVAQSFILSDLLDKANVYLSNISDRYELFCKPGSLTIMMKDHYQGNIERPTNTLSGGEAFIISLSLALGLSSMQNVDFKVDTLFIDEGFGTLSPDYLNTVIETLTNLNRMYGRRIGIISHVEALKQSIHTVIEVTKKGTSSSDVSVVDYQY